MKGFPNQVADLAKLTGALRIMAELVGQGMNVRDDGVYGEALIRSNVLRTGHTPIPINDYLRAQRSKRRSRRSFEASARGLWELFRILAFIDDTADQVRITAAAKKIITLEDAKSTEGLRSWRSAILTMVHDGGDGESSHPYQVLLRLVAKCPGITRAKCALALEAKNDSEEELSRIVELSALTEERIRKAIACKESNWKNAKKILPKFAEQLGDVRKIRNKFYLADVPGGRGEVTEEQRGPKPRSGPRKPKQSSAVTATTIAKAATTEGWDEAEPAGEEKFDPTALRRRNEIIKDRLHRHNLLVQKAAAALESEGAQLFENPFDCLAVFAKYGLLLEVKTLDGTEPDEVSRARDALAQLLYYEAFVVQPLTRELAVKKVAYFETAITADHVEWLQRNNILVIWNTASGFDGTARTKKELSGHFGF